MADPTSIVDNLLASPEDARIDLDESAMSGVCECDVEHQLIDSVCPWCKAHGRQRWNDPADVIQHESSEDAPERLVRSFVDDAIPENPDQVQIDQALARRGFRPVNFEKDDGLPPGAYGDYKEWRYWDANGKAQYSMEPIGCHWRLTNIGADSPTHFSASLAWCLRQFDRDQKRKLRQEGLDDPAEFVRHHIDATSQEQAAEWQAIAVEQRSDYQQIALRLEVVAKYVARLNRASTAQDRADAEAGTGWLIDKLSEYDFIVTAPDYPALPSEHEKLTGVIDIIGFCTGNSDGAHSSDAAQLLEAAKLLRSIK